MHGLVTALLVLAAAQEAPRQAALPSAAGSSRMLVVTYSDGRTSPRILTPRGGGWTPTFPRQANPPAQGDLPLAALLVEHVVERDVVVTVSLLYGSPHQRKVHVATVRVAGGDPVPVNELRAFGVDPIMLSIDRVSPAALVQPSVDSASALLDVGVDLASHDLPVYSITFRNRSARAVMAVSFRLYRGDKQVGSGRRKTNRNTPVIEPAGEYFFTMQAASATAHGFDRLEVTSVLWDDGSVEGDPELKRSEQALTVGFAQQLRRVLALLRKSADTEGSSSKLTSISRLRAAVDALPIRVEPGLPPELSSASVKIGQQQVKEAVLQDLDDYLRPQSGAVQPPVQPWVERALPQYSAWLARTGVQ